MSERCPQCQSTKVVSHGMRLEQWQTIFWRRCAQCGKVWSITQPKGPPGWRKESDAKQSKS